MITEFYRNGSMLLISQKGSAEGAAIIVKSRDGSWKWWPESRIRASLEKLGKKELFRGKIIIFVIGIIFSFFGILIEIIEQMHAKAKKIRF